MGTIHALWIPCVVLAHAFGIICLVLGPLRLWLDSQGGTKAYIARRRGSTPGKLPKLQETYEASGESLLFWLAFMRPHQWHDLTPASSPATGHADTVAAQGKDSKTGAHQVKKIHLEWQSIHCSYAAAHGKINILHDIWGKAAPGEMQVNGFVPDTVAPCLLPMF